MPRKRVKKASSSGNSRNENVEKVLIENFIALQKVMTNLSVKFDHLSNNISKLLEVFEISAKALAEKDFEMGNGKEMSQKLDKLLDQNKVLAKGIAFLHDDYIGEEDDNEKPSPAKKQPEKKVQPQETSERKTSAIDIGDYEKSISADQPSQKTMSRMPVKKRSMVREEPEGNMQMRRQEPRMQQNPQHNESQEENA